MPHEKMQEYVNVDYRNVLSIVALVGDPGKQTIVAEARFAKDQSKPVADVAFVVDEAYQGIGIATHIYLMMAKIAKEKGVHSLTADVLASNQAMLKVFEKGPYPVQAKMEEGAYALTVDLTR